MTTDRDAHEHLVIRNTGAALVMAAGAILVALSVYGVLTATGVISLDYETFSWPVYAVLVVASAALFRLGLQNWRKL